jgi:integrase
MPLSEAAVRSAKPKDKSYKLTDAAGLYLFVPVTGNRIWRYDYRFENKRRTLTIGAYPLIGLAEARKRRDDAKRLLLDGIDPVSPKRKAALNTAKPTFGLVADEYIARLRHDERAETTVVKNEWLLGNLAADLRGKAIDEITPADVLSVLRNIEASGRLESAHRVRSAISAVFRLAVATLRATNDPTFPLRGAIKRPKVTNHPAITDETRFGVLLASIGEYDGWPTLKALLLFTALTATRPGEARGAEWSEFDLDAAKWVIPAPRTKMRREHDVPLSRQAVAVLKDVARISGRARLVFPSIRSLERPLSENAMNAALRRIGFTKTEHNSHGFRSSFSTILNARGFDPEVIERSLAHQDSSVRAIYNRSRYWKDRIELMQQWADIVDELAAAPK